MTVNCPCWHLLMHLCSYSDRAKFIRVMQSYYKFLIVSHLKTSPRWFFWAWCILQQMTPVVCNNLCMALVWWWSLLNNDGNKWIWNGIVQCCGYYCTNVTLNFLLTGGGEDGPLILKQVDYVTWSRGMSRMSGMLFLRLAKTVFKFLCFILFLALSNPS